MPACANHYVVCQFCGITFRSYPSRPRKFCSKQCKDAALVGQPSPKRSGVVRLCKQCGASFDSYPTDKQKYCSLDCRNQSMRKKRLEMPCTACGQIVYPHPSRLKHGKTIFCSPNCKKTYQSGHNSVHWKSSVTLVCEQCGALFERKPHLASVRFCSRQCRNNWLRENITSPTSIELAIEQELKSMGIDYRPQHQIDRWSCDFYIPAAKLVIECDGNYWHSLPDVQRKDRKKDRWLTNNGYKILHLSEDTITNDLPRCKAQIANHLD